MATSIVKAPKPSQRAPKPAKNGAAALTQTPLAKRLQSLRAQGIAEGLKPLSRAQILSLKHENRGGTHWPGERS